MTLPGTPDRYTAAIYRSETPVPSQQFGIVSHERPPLARMELLWPLPFWAAEVPLTARPGHTWHTPPGECSSRPGKTDTIRLVANPWH